MSSHDKVKDFTKKRNNEKIKIKTQQERKKQSKKKAALGLIG